jgi:hypothetical protein
MENKKLFKKTIRETDENDESGYDEFGNVQEKLKLALDDVVSDPSNPEKTAHFEALKKIRDQAVKFREDVKKTGASKPQETYGYEIPKAYPEAFIGSSSRFGGLRGALETAKNKLLPPEVKTKRTAIVQEPIIKNQASRAPASVIQPQKQGIGFEEFTSLPQEAQEELRQTHLYDEETESYLPRDVVLKKRK